VTLKGNRPKRRKGKGDESAIGRFSEKVQRMPLLVYVLGVPTKVAVGTDLFEVVISASYGTMSRYQRKRGHHDYAGDAHRRGRWSTDWRSRRCR
jgi:hypothetical protein